MSEQGNELQRSLNRYLRRNQIMGVYHPNGIILFLSILFIYRSFSKSTKTPLRKLQRSDYTNARTKILKQETRIQQLEEQIKKLQENQI